MSHQDWKVVTFKKKIKKPQNKKIVKKKPNLNLNSNKLKKNISTKKLESDEPPKLQKIDKNVAKKIQQARNALKMTQQDLARKINVKKSIINDIETGKLLKNNFLINKVKKALKIK